MLTAGFVLVGGRSSRMGRDKALLPFAGGTLAGHMARQVEQVAGSAVFLGEPATYEHLGWPVWPDAVPGLGPLAGLTAMLRGSQADWNLIAACDLPQLTAADLQLLMSRALEGKLRAVLARDAAGRVQPLCGVYHRSCLTEVQSALAARELRVTSVVERIQPQALVSLPGGALRNLNTPADWEALESVTA